MSTIRNVVDKYSREASDYLTIISDLLLEMGLGEENKGKKVLGGKFTLSFGIDTQYTAHEQLVVHLIYKDYGFSVIFKKNQELRVNMYMYNRGKGKDHIYIDGMSLGKIKNLNPDYLEKEIIKSTRSLMRQPGNKKVYEAKRPWFRPTPQEREHNIHYLIEEYEEYGGDPSELEGMGYMNLLEELGYTDFTYDDWVEEYEDMQ